MLPLSKKIKEATSTPKRKIVFVIIMIIVGSSITLSIVYWNTIKKALIKQKVKLAVQDKSNRLYNVHYDDMELDEVSGYLSIKNLSLNYDTLTYKALQNNGIPGTLFRINIPLIIIAGIQTPKALIAKEIIGRKIEIINPLIDIIYTRRGTDSTKGIPTTEVYRQILGDLQLIKVDSFLITGAKITTIDLVTGKQKLLLTNTHLQLHDVAIDSISNKDTSRILFSKRLLINCSNLLWNAANKLYQYSFDEVTLNSDDQNASVQRFRVIPMLNETQFAQKKIYQADRYDITLNNINIDKLNFLSLLKESFFAESITINNASIRIYRDMTRKPDGKNRIGTYPQQRIMQIPIPIAIDKITLQNSYVEYKEKGRLMQKIGKVIFANMNGTFNNITNINSSIKENNAFTANINANFLRRYPVKTSWHFYLNNTKGRFDVSGKLGSLKAPELNVLLEPLGGVRIEKGRINELSFDFKADNYGMKGPVKFSYNDLKVSVLKKDKESKELSKRKLLSVGANMLIYDDNPSRNKTLRIGEADFTRDTTRSMFHMCWKTLEDGIKSSAIKN